jgi:hypothetical protein
MDINHFLEKLLEKQDRIAAALESIAAAQGSTTVHIPEVGGGLPAEPAKEESTPKRGRPRKSAAVQEAAPAPTKSDAAKPPASEDGGLDLSGGGDDAPEAGSVESAGAAEDDLGFLDDGPSEEEPPALTQMDVRNKLHEVARLPGHGSKAAKEILMNNSSNKADEMGKLEPKDFNRVFKAAQAAIDKAKKATK